MKRWTKLYLALQLAILQAPQELHAAGKCQTSVEGIALFDHTFLTIPNKNIDYCFHECKQYEACQSINYFKTSHLCQLNNRSVTTKPEKKILLKDSVYFEHPQPTDIGSHEKAPAESCMEIKEITNNLISGYYWLKHPLTSNVSQIFCNITTGEAEGCTTSPCKNQGTCNNVKYGDYHCTCTVAFKGVHCELPANDPCEVKPCQNGGTCRDTGINDFTCACVAGYAGKTCDVISSTECSLYSNISDSTRSINHGISSKTCDSSLATKWYRFVGPAGVRLPTSSPPKSRCNTDATGWLNGAHPTVPESIVTRTVCFNWSTNTCNFNVVIRVRNCGPYFVYELKPAPACSLRYCVTN